MRASRDFPSQSLPSTPPSSKSKSAKKDYKITTASLDTDKETINHTIPTERGQDQQQADGCICKEKFQMQKREETEQGLCPPSQPTGPHCPRRCQPSPGKAPRRNTTQQHCKGKKASIMHVQSLSVINVAGDMSGKVAPQPRMMFC